MEGDEGGSNPGVLALPETNREQGDYAGAIVPITAFPPPPIVLPPSVPAAQPSMFLTRFSVRHRAYDIFHHMQMEATSQEYPGLREGQLLSIIGERWNMSDESLKEPFLRHAEGELQELLDKRLVDPAVLQRKRHRRTKAEIEAAREQLILTPTSGKRRGRPPKPGSVARVRAPRDKSHAGVIHGVSAQVGVKGGTKENGPSISPALVGMKCSGELDGMFDAGYFITIRVENTDTVFRGLVFSAAVGVPLTAANDAFPDVRVTERSPSQIPLPPDFLGYGSRLLATGAVGSHLGEQEMGIQAGQQIPSQSTPKVSEQVMEILAQPHSTPSQGD